jgi:NurA-like 5'-3' nuclease
MLPLMGYVKNGLMDYKIMPLEDELPFESPEEAFIRMSKSILSSLNIEKSKYKLEWEEIPEGSHENIAAVDGGSGILFLNQGQVMFLTSSSLFQRDERIRRSRKYHMGVLDAFAHNERVSICRKTMEVKMAIRTVESLNPDLLLLDGSLKAFVDGDIWATPFGSRYPASDVRKFLDKLLMGIEGMGLDLASGFVPLTHSQEYSREIDAMIGEVLEGSGGTLRKDELLRARAYLERYEFLYSMNKLLSMSKNVVAISKRSGSNAYFGSEIPDIEIVRRCYEMRPGFLKPISMNLDFQYHGIDSSYPIKLTYARLERGANVLRIEVLGDREDIGEILGSLARDSIKGYPYHLRIAHEMAKVGRKLIQFLTKNLHLDLVSGREVLGE